MDSEVNVFCVYTDFSHKNSYLSQSLPEGCPEMGNYVFKFFAISPDLGYIPPGTNLFEAVNIGKTTQKINLVYDPFHMEKGETVRFIAWMYEIPHSVPLYIYDCEGSVTISEIPQENKSPSLVVYVLSKKDFPEGFLFQNVGNRAIPNPNGNKLSKIVREIHEEPIPFEKLASKLHQKHMKSSTIPFFLILFIILLVMIFAVIFLGT